MSSFNSNVPVDPLKLIRIAYSVNKDTDRNPFNYCTSSGEVLDTLTADCTHITVPSGQPSRPFLIFPRSVSTNYRSKKGNGPHYPLDSICFLLERKDDSYTNYLQDVRRLGLTVVSLPDKKELVEYLMMVNEEGQYAAIDKDAELPVPLMLFPESPEALREMEQKAAVSGTSKKREKEKRSEEIREDSEAEEIETSSTKRPATSKSSGDSNDSSLVRPVQSTEALFHCDKDFTPVNLTLKNYLSTVLASKSASNPSNKPVSLLDQISSMNTNNKRDSNTSTSVAPVWIIIVPAGSAALLTLHNVKDFLLDSKYISVNEARARGPKPSSVRLEHSGHSFEFIDNPARLSLSDWSRVLACFTLTSTWQFKGWKWETPLELFQHISGFHVYFDDVALDPTVAGWNVTRLALSRNKRHLDATAVMTFWTRINDAIKARLSKKL